MRGLILLVFGCIHAEADESGVLDTGPLSCDAEGDIYKMFPRLLLAHCSWTVRCLEENTGEVLDTYDCVNGTHLGPLLRDEGNVYCIDWCEAREFSDKYINDDFQCSEGSIAATQPFYTCDEQNF